ncbi:VOC family protein [Martelella mediterranea]|uniref:Glyoxalase-like protein n=1 Tax=Martelella mediterranea TaxID=293089 RepID=A0A4V2V4I5_9HYPH|nr:VOC family protein [Martelella mediterranea]TCT39277.1 glyoxalase-like protein [Martelella mediterranea]
MSLSSRTARSLDHLVLPVVDLATSRLRLVSLGFTVAPDASHPFGTGNACVYFSDSTYLEPLAIRDLRTYEAKIAERTEFVRRDRAYRFRVGEDGLSAVVFKAEDAEADHAAFSKAGIVENDLFEFSRPFELDDGTKTTAGFKLAFAADLRAPDIFFFVCERLTPLSPAASLLAHANGVTGIAEVLLTEEDPMEFEPLLQVLSNSHDIDIHPHGFSVEVGSSRLSVYTPDHLKQAYGVDAVASQRGLFASGVVFAAPDLLNVKDILQHNDLPYSTLENGVSVSPASGQGVAFVFKEE